LLYLNTFYGVSSVDDLGGNSIVDDGSWHHVAITYDGNTKRMYIDGVLDASESFSQIIRQNNLNVRLWYNEEYESGEYSGILDEVLIFNRALNQAEILELINK
jgi:hypothetical protein